MQITTEVTVDDIVRVFETHIVESNNERTIEAMDAMTRIMALIQDVAIDAIPYDLCREFQHRLEVQAARYEGR